MHRRRHRRCNDVTVCSPHAAHSNPAGRHECLLQEYGTGGLYARPGGQDATQVASAPCKGQLDPRPQALACIASLLSHSTCIHKAPRYLGRPPSAGGSFESTTGAGRGANAFGARRHPLLSCGSATRHCHCRDPGKCVMSGIWPPCCPHWTAVLPVQSPRSPVRAGFRSTRCPAKLPRRIECAGCRACVPAARMRG